MCVMSSDAIHTAARRCRSCGGRVLLADLADELGTTVAALAPQLLELHRAGAVTLKRIDLPGVYGTLEREAASTVRDGGAEWQLLCLPAKEPGIVERLRAATAELQRQAAANECRDVGSALTDARDEVHGLLVELEHVLAAVQDRAPQGPLAEAGAAYADTFERIRAIADRNGEERLLFKLKIWHGRGCDGGPEWSVYSTPRGEGVLSRTADDVVARYERLFERLLANGADAHRPGAEVPA